MIIQFFAEAIPLQNNWSWIDIGAHHPTYLNNTAMFYQQGNHGVNIEANPQLMKPFYRQRPKDINLNVAIADKRGTMNFYIMDVPTLCTLSEKEAHEYEKMGFKINDVIPVQTMPVVDVVDKYCGGVFPDLLSLDAEGYDLEILQTIDMQKTFPKIICVENIPFKNKIINCFESMQKNDISLYLQEKNYSIIAFTSINAIFVHNDLVEKPNSTL